MTIEFLPNREAFDKVIASEKPTLVDFTADWCGPCKGLSPILQDLAENEWAETCTVVKVDIDDNPDIAEAFNIQGVPALLLFEESELMVQVGGALPKAQLIQKFDPFL